MDREGEGVKEDGEMWIERKRVWKRMGRCGRK